MWKFTLEKLVSSYPASYPSRRGIRKIFHLVQTKELLSFQAALYEQSTFDKVNWPIYHEASLNFCYLRVVKNSVKTLKLKRLFTPNKFEDMRHDLRLDECKSHRRIRVVHLFC